jgi:hypothetical protein
MDEQAGKICRKPTRSRIIIPGKKIYGIHQEKFAACCVRRMCD